MKKNILNKDWGIAFGGGGAKGSAHIGIVKYLQETNAKPYAISGCSIGAFVAAMYAFGISHQEIKEAFLELEPFKLAFLKPTPLGVMKNKSLHNALLNHFGHKTKIEDAKIPLGIHTTNIVTGKPYPLYEGNLIEAVLSSCCVPGLYIPNQQEDKILVDGGLTENVPLSLLSDLGAEKTIAVNLNGHTVYSRPKNVLDVLTNSFDIAIDHTTRTQLLEADVVFNLDLSMYSRFQIENVDEIITKGYDIAKEEFYVE
ncbi:MAG: patatin [Oligoflexia bacterium]|nr:patatin [Oligoflexia bacterium]